MISAAGAAIGPVVSVEVTATDESSVSIAWPPVHDNDVVGYGIYVNGTRVGTQTPDQTKRWRDREALTYTVERLSCGTGLTVGVDTFDRGDRHSTPMTTTVSTTACPDAAPPSTPSGIRQVAATEDSVMLAWSPSTDNVGVVEYGVYASGLRVATSSEPSATLSHLHCGTSYVVAIDAADAAGERSAQATTYLRTAACASANEPPSTPTGLRVTAATGTSVALAWTASTDDVAVAGYGLYVAGQRTGQTTDTSAAFTDLRCGTTYALGVDAYDAAGKRTPVVEVSTATTPCASPPSTATDAAAPAVGTAPRAAGRDTTAPSTPGNLRVAAADGTSVTVAWNPSTDDVGVTGYDVYRGTTKLGTTTTTSYALTGLTCGTAYSVAVSALDKAGNASPRATMSASTAACPDNQPPTAPANVTVSTRTTTTIALSWAAATDNIGVRGYGIYNGAQLVDTTTGTTGIVGNLTCGTNYTLALDAFDTAGNRSPKTSVMVATLPCPQTQPTGPSVVASDAATGSAGPSLTVPAPSGSAAGQVLVAGVAARIGATVSITPPSGWTLVRRDSSTAGATLTQAVYVRVAGTAEPSSYSWAFGSAGAATAVIARVAGVDTSSPILTSSGRYTSNTSSISAPSLSVGVAGSSVVGFFGNNGTKPSTPPTGMNEIADRQGGTTSGSALEAAHSIQVSAGSTGDRTALSADAGNSSNIGQLVALRPAGGSTPPPPPPPSPPPPSSPPPGSSVGTSLPGALPASAGRSFYVSPSGSDTAAGSVSAPWRTVQKALDTLQPGDTAYLRGGTYSTWVTMSRSGTASAPITVRSYPGERATLTGRFKITGSWFRLTDLTFDGRYQLDETLIYPAAPASNLEISRCEIMRAGLTGTSSHSGNGIYIAPGTSSIRVLYNSIHDNGTSDRYHHGIYASGTGHLIAGNVIRNNSAYGIQLYPDADSAVVAANTIVGNPRAGIVIGSDGSTTSSGNRVVDNVVAFNGEYGVRTYWGAAEGTGNVVQTNLLYGNPGGATYGSGLTVSGSIASDPAFVDRSGGDLRLQSGSPAVDRGVASWSTPYDVAGVARPKGAGVDLGAYER